MYKSFIFPVLIIFLLSPALTAQETKEIKGVKGTAYIVGGVSELDAQKEALNEAKIEALRQAGVKEHLQAYELLFRSETERDYSKFFSSDVQSELNGAVQNYEIINQERVVDASTKLFMIEVTIDATVITYSSSPDPTFNVEVKGIKGIYESGENLEFTVYSTIDCYLNIFNITDIETLLLYPNQYEKKRIIPGEKVVEFPFGLVDYYLGKNRDEPEVNRLIFVFTKEPVEYLNFSDMYQLTTQKDVFSWVYSLTPEIRKIHYQSFMIR